MYTALLFGFLLVATFTSIPSYYAHAERGSGSAGTIKTEDSIKLDSLDDDGTSDQGKGDFDTAGNQITTSGDDDGTPDQGRGDFDAFSNPSDDSNNISSDDDGTLDQGRGDFDADGNTINNSQEDTPSDRSDNTGGDDSDDSFFDTFHKWFSRLFSWWD